MTEEVQNTSTEFASHSSSLHIANDKLDFLLPKRKLKTCIKLFQRSTNQPCSLILSAANLPEVKAQALLAPEGESVPITPPTTSPAA